MVRKSLEILSRKGLITTRRGVGSFVTFGGKTVDDHTGWSVTLSSGETELATRVFRLARGEMDLVGAPDTAGTDVLMVDRLRFRATTGQSVSLERSRLPWRAGFSEILESGLKKSINENRRTI
ncbi:MULTISPECIES: hypothetical protein [unclassified Ruegeria]|uniref:hypothetical protein n=1 Tax=unclassified Ruegeria TaxID=2625375 RepID=UPI001581F85E|nr:MULTISPECIES: hypothetical protein [unclassified Ruegeria]